MTVDLNLDPEKLAEAFTNPRTRRMALGSVREARGESSRNVAKALGMSIFQYQDVELGRRPLSEQAFIKAMQFLGVTPEYLAKALLDMHQMLLDIADVWPQVWRERLEPLDFETRRDLVLADKELQSWGLGELFCDKSLEVGDPEAAVQFAELALLVMETSRELPEYKRRLCGYARGHLGRALVRRGDSEAASAVYAQAIEEWMTGKGTRPEDERQVRRLAAIVPGFPKEEALRKPRRARKAARKPPKDSGD